MDRPNGHGDQSAPLIGVTGSTGALGGRVARRLAAAGARQRLVVRDPARAHPLPGATVAVASYGDGAAARQALAGVDVLFMVSGTEAADRVEQHRAFVDAAAAAGVRHLVYTSYYGAAPDATFTLGRQHWATEQHIRASGMAFTFLRDNLYADFLPAMVGKDDVIRGPAGDGRVSAVARDDVTDVAAAVLLDPAAYAGATLDLTGPQALTLAEIAATIGRVLGRAIRYQPETLEEAYASRARYGAPLWQVDAWVSTYIAIAAGEMDGVSSAVADVTGHPATSVEQVIRGG